MITTGVRTCIVMACAVALGGIASAVAASAAVAAPRIVAIDVTGEPVEGATLTAVVEVVDAGENTTTHYAWLRCPATGPVCAPIEGAEDAPSYRLTAADVGSRVAVTVQLLNPRSGKEQDTGTSDPTEVVRKPYTLPDAPVPPGDTGASGGQTFVQEGVTPVGTLTPAPPATPSPATGPGTPPALRYMSPFPVVRIRGELAERGVRVTLLRVTAGRRAVVRVRCRGRGCPVARLRRGPGRLAAFQRFLPAGLRITIRVTRPNRIGKHVRLRIRDGRPPARIDACILPGTSTPAPCPAP